MKHLSEKQIQSKILKILRRKPKTKVIKIITATTDGEPDIVVCYKGKFIGIEVKSHTGRARGLQVAKIKEIRKAGGVAFVLREPELVSELLKVKKVDVFDPIEFSKFLLSKDNV